MARIKSNTRILKRNLKEAAYKREQEILQSVANQAADLPTSNSYPQIEPGKIEYTPEYPRVVLVETREVWSDGSITNFVRSTAKGR